MHRVSSFGQPEEASLAQLHRCLDVSGIDAIGVLCADHHKGYSMPIGGVVASREFIMPAGVGFDIGCGNCAVRTNLRADDVQPEMKRIMDEVARVLSFGMGQQNNERIKDHVVYELIDKSPLKEVRELLPAARTQLGTIGSGNHYVDIFRGDDGYVWVGVHFGSRGFGHKIATGFLALAAGRKWGEHANDSMDATPATIHLDSSMGAAYLDSMRIAGDYAYAGRNWVVNRVLRILGGDDTLRIHNHHNFAWIEEHEGQKWLVTRKGATPAFPGQRGFVGSSMLGESVIIEGVDSEASRQTLYSAMHGAGRVMSRTKAAGKFNRKKVWKCLDYRKCDGTAPLSAPAGADGSHPKCPKCGHATAKRVSGELLQAGVVDWPATLERARVMGVELRGGGADEAPDCYKNLDHVLAEHEGTIKVLHRLTPMGVAMAGKDVVDDYRD